MGNEMERSEEFSWRPGYDEQSPDTPPLLARLKNTVYNPEIILEPVFDESMYPDRKEALRQFQADCCTAFEALYNLAAQCWNDSH